ncbi:MAG: 30S ribosomal protein S16 [Candidatus Moranbacteria bacterium]|jgi:small subunit ribosomal protein S16|nr:30S ribosomal protein S16 [Candidatus Moranbacteria bacterium]NLC31076.1 30S ribosomal protein S16 [Candidatus Moranbacteria bacterium]
MIVIRFSRTGRKNKPQFRLVVQEHTAAPTGRHIEIVGSWDPHQKKGVFKNERIQYWLSQGAQASDTVFNLLVSQKIIEGAKRVVKMKKAEKPAEEAPAEEKKEEKKTEEVAAEEKKEEVKVEEAPKA